jgi:hypothetical protein
MVPVMILSAIRFSPLRLQVALKTSTPRRSWALTDLFHPRGGFRTLLSSGRIDRNQAMTATIGTMRELTLVLHDEVEGLSF